MKANPQHVNMRSINTQIPLVLLAVLLLSAFVPVIPLTLIYVNSMLNALLEIALGKSSTAFYNGINIVGTIASLVVYILAKRRIWKIISTCLYALFLIPFAILNTENWVYDNLPYFLPFLIHGVIIVIPLYLIGIVKERRQHK